MAVVDYLDRGALINPDGICVSMGVRQYRYREFRALVNRIANGLLALGFGPGHHAAVLTGNDPDAYACTLGIMRAGLAYIPLDFRNSAEDNRRILEFGDATVLFYQRAYQTQVDSYRAALPKLQVLVCIDADADGAPDLQIWSAAFSDAAPAVEVPLDATAWLQTGSGTSGDFRMAMIPHRAYHAFVAFQAIWLPDQHPVMLVAAPIAHAGGGLSYRVLALGGRLVLMDRPEPQALLRTIQDERITELFLPPTVIYRLLAQPNVRTFDYSSLKAFAFSAAPMAVEKLRQAIEVFGPVMAQAYGQTEALGITQMRPEEFLIDGAIASDLRLAACGRPALPFCRIALVDDEHRPVARGQRGEICARGDQVMSGYYKNPEATARTLIGGWVHTGDVGYLDAEGYLHIVDRKKDMIISGGFNIYPNEIEQVILECAGIEDCAVIGVPDADWGEAVKAVIEPIRGQVPDTGAILAHCRKRLGPVKTPKSVDIVDELPRSARGKVLKRVLREPYWPLRQIPDTGPGTGISG